MPNTPKGMTLITAAPAAVFWGIRSIFVEQSNDLALGLPIVKALYTQSHPEFINYQFLLPVISLILLNPLGESVTCGEFRRVGAYCAAVPQGS